jgi:CBS domain-containing protein
MNTGIIVREVMVANPLCTEKTTSVQDCARQMASEKIGSLLIVEVGAIIGIITEQDLSRKVLAGGLSVDTNVGSVMSTEISSVTSDMDVYEAMLLMGKKNIKHLPVIDKGKLIGIVSFKDIIGVQPGLIELLSFKKNSGNVDSVFASER